MLINTITSAMSGFAAYIVLKLVGVDFAVTLALMVFLLNFIPNIGSILATAIPTLLALTQFDTMTPALIVLVFYGGSDAIIGNVIQPRLQGKSLNMSTFMVMVSLTFWGTMWGAVGAFMAVPMMVVTMIICTEIPALRPFAVLLSGDGNLDTAEAEAPTPAPGKSQADPPPGQGPTTNLNPPPSVQGVSD
jgi:predicted PurR-regulated permease PerM